MAVTSASNRQRATATASAAGLTPGAPGSSWSMATQGKPVGPPAIEPTPAAERGERWWPVALAIIVVAFLHVILPARYRVQPAWVVPAVLLVLLAVLIVGDPGRFDRQKTGCGSSPASSSPSSPWRTCSPPSGWSWTS